MELLYVDGSPLARIVRILIAEWQLPVALREVDFPLPPELDELTPMGQVPLLLMPEQNPLFPTFNIIEYLATLAPEGVPFGYNNSGRMNLVIALTAGDALAHAAYERWSGLGQVSFNSLGFETGARNIERFNRTVAWLVDRVETNTLVSLVVAILLDWARDRKVVGVDTRNTYTERFVGILSRPLVAATAPRPHNIEFSL